ncbi:MAG TPA: VOC family protein [Beijerinckiaceae bacterium]|jgi:predicted 3-demethylubiquinone-9 3-methyltransferase (glyoxalase superfamily)
MDAITPCLWFNGVAEEAARFYAALIPNSKVVAVNRAPADTPSGPAGSVLTVEFILAGRSFLGLNGGPQFAFTEAVSFILPCESQAEVDRLWAALSEGGSPGPCGWLKDRYGLSWQVVPREALAMLKDQDQARAGRVLQAIMGMSKIEMEPLRQAWAA